MLVLIVEVRIWKSYIAHAIASLPLSLFPALLFFVSTHFPQTLSVCEQRASEEEMRVLEAKRGTLEFANFWIELFVHGPLGEIPFRTGGMASTTAPSPQPTSHRHASADTCTLPVGLEGNHKSRQWRQQCAVHSYILLHLPFASAWP